MHRSINPAAAPPASTSAVYEACIDGGDCRSDKPGEFCVECGECIDVTRTLARALRAPCWETSGVDADGPEPPEELRNSRIVVESWHRAWALRQELEKAPAKVKAT